MNLYTLALFTAYFATVVLGQSAPGTTPVDPNATCPQQTADQITNCLAVIEADEAKLPSGPCSSDQWGCICNVSVSFSLLASQ